MRQSVTLYVTSGKTRYGKESYEAATTQLARVNEKSKVIFKPNGETITILANAYFNSTVTISIDDKVTYNSNDYKVFSKKIVRGQVGKAHHIKVELIKWQS